MPSEPVKTDLVVPVGESDHVQGLASAQVTLVEYGDYECPICGQAYPVVKMIQKRMGEQLRFVFRNFPVMEFHRHAQLAAEAAEAAAAQGKFWEMHDRLFEHQRSLDNSHLMQYAADLELDIQKFGQEMARHVYAERIRADKEGGIRSAVKTTPGFFINGIRHDTSFGFKTLLPAALAASKP